MLQRLRHRVQRQEGFTLIELLVVILIIGILAAVAIPTFLSQKGKAQDANAQSNLSTIASAEATYNTSNNSYATGSAGLTALGKIEPAVNQFSSTIVLSTTAPSNASDPAGGGTVAWNAQANSSSGVQYTITQYTDGGISYTCNVTASAANPGGCNITASNATTGVGTWAAKAAA